MSDSEKHNRIIITEYQPEKTDRIFITTALFKDQELLEVRCRQKDHPTILGNIYIGRVQKVVKNIQAAFVEFLPGKNGYLPLEDCKNALFSGRAGKGEVVQGAEIAVQVAKENLKTKLPVLTANLSIPGSYLVLTSGNKTVGISSKIYGERKTELKKMFSDKSDSRFGIVVRTNARDASDQLLLEEYEKLSGEMVHLLDGIAFRTCFSCIRKAPSEYTAILKNSRFSELVEIVTDLPDVYEEIKSSMESLLSQEKVGLRLYDDISMPLASLYNLRKQLERALSEKVWLKSGGYLVIEPTEALTVIDVNSGKSTARKNPQEHFLKINREAAVEIARQIRLRNISGIIIVDFIDMKAETDRKLLMDELSAHVKKDSVPVQVIDITKLNLVEMTRKKVSRSLREIINE